MDRRLRPTDGAGAAGLRKHRGGAGKPAPPRSCHANPSPERAPAPGHAHRPQAGLPATASTGARAFAFTLGVRALLRMSVFTYFVE